MLFNSQLFIKVHTHKKDILDVFKFQKNYIQCYKTYAFDVNLCAKIFFPRCLIDAGFGYLKKLLRRSEVESYDQLADVTSKSARSNHAVCFREDNGEQTWQWLLFLYSCKTVFYLRIIEIIV